MIGVLALILKSLPFYKAYIKAMMMPEHLEKCTVTTGVLIYALVEMSLGKQSFRLLTNSQHQNNVGTSSHSDKNT